MKQSFWLAPILFSVTACDSPPPAGSDAAVVGRDGAVSDADAAVSTVARAALDFGADLTDPAQFYRVPYPNDLHLSAAGTPDLRGLPYPRRVAILQGLVEAAQEHPRFPMVSVAYFVFDAPVAPQSLDRVIAARADAPVLLVDVDPDSPERGRLFPVVAQTLDDAGYFPADALAVAARPGFVLRPNTRYAVVVKRALNDAQGRPLGRPDALDALAHDMAPAGAMGTRARDLYRPMWATLETLRVPADDVAAATVFTTGDVVADTAALGDRVVQRYDVAIENLRLAAGDSPTTHPRFCQLVGTIRPPQFQRGAPPFNSEGTFQIGADGLPVAVTYPANPEYGAIPVTITLPRTAMPAGGFPLVQYFHGSGGVSNAVVDRGTWRPRSASNPCPDVTDDWMGVLGCNTLGEGPAHHFAARGFATAGSALPVNPERFPGATTYQYLNFNNPKSFRDIFRQGVLEQRLYLEALTALRIPQGLVAQCTGVTLPAGTTEARFDVSRLVTMGQSMGGMYTNLIAATEPAVRAAIPTGAGGFWPYMVLTTQAVPGAAALLRQLLMAGDLSWVHPALSVLETAWEAAEPMVYTPRVALSPLPMHPVRHVYQPCAEGDSFFSTQVYDAIAVAYGHQEAGAAVWPTMQDALALDARAGIIPYPVRANRTSRAMSTPYTSAIVQYRGDGVYDPHAIYTQLDAVKYQYGCFAQSFVRTGVGVIVDPTGHGADDACP